MPIRKLNRHDGYLTKIDNKVAIVVDGITAGEVTESFVKNLLERHNKKTYYYFDFSLKEQNQLRVFVKESI